jgi:anti-sigma regulatory factor (Ser/Thr protein kinase)
MSISHVLDEAAGEDLRCRGERLARVDLSEARFVDPHGLLSLLECCRHAKNLGRRIAIAMPADDDVLSYLERIGFVSHVRSFAVLFTADSRRYVPESSTRCSRERKPEDSQDEGGEDSSASFSSEIQDSAGQAATRKAGEVVDTETPHVVYPKITGSNRSFQRPSDVLLEITLVENSQDVHTIVGQVKQRAHLILKKHLGYDKQKTVRFIVALAELCQNIFEHSNTVGYVAIQKYRYSTLGRNVVKMAVTDTGIGMKQSLAPRLATQFGSKWSDMTAIDQAFQHGVSRFADPGRGHGLRCVRELVAAWDGKISIRSGRARLSVAPRWARGLPTDDSLPYFPGTQIFLTLPAEG